VQLVPVGSPDHQQVDVIRGRSGLADRPVEEQRGDTWEVTWALPVDEDDRLVPLPDEVPGVVRAPTPVDDPLTVPAVLVAPALPVMPPLPIVPPLALTVMLPLAVVAWMSPPEPAAL